MTAASAGRVSAGAGLLALEFAASAAVSFTLLGRGVIAVDLALLLVCVPLVGMTAAAVRHTWQDVTLPAGLGLNLIGLHVLSVVAPSFARLQCAWSFLALATYAVVTALPQVSTWPRRWPFLSFALAMVLFLLTFVVGTNPEGVGPKQWLAVGSFYFQPAELLKLALALLLAWQLGQSADDERLIGWWLLPPAAAVLAMVAQSDLGSAAIAAAVSGTILLAARGNRRRLMVGLLVAAVVAAGTFALVPRARLRLEDWLHPFRDPLGKSYQIVQSLRAIAAGGLWGKGLAASDTLHVPASHTDLILSAVGERLGLAGTLLVFALFGLLLWRIARSAARCTRRFESLAHLGISSLLIGQAVIISAGTLSLLPLTGVTLPFVSYGGSSLLTSYLAIGLLACLGPRCETTDPASPVRRWGRPVYAGLATALAVVAASFALWALLGSAVLTRSLPSA